MGVCALLPVVVSQSPPFPSGVFGRRVDEGTGVPILPQDFGEMMFFLPQVVLPTGDGSVEQALDQFPLYTVDNTVPLLYHVQKHNQNDE